MHVARAQGMMQIRVVVIGLGYDILNCNDLWLKSHLLPITITQILDSNDHEYWINAYITITIQLHN